MSPLISIVTICRNDVDALQRTYRSVLAQERSLFEWIVIDGASTDATLDFLKTLPSDLVQWTSEPDEGIYDAMNKGILSERGSILRLYERGRRLRGKRHFRPRSSLLKSFKRYCLWRRDRGLRWR